MRARVLLSTMLLLALAAAPGAQQAPDAEPTQLPVRRVVLYKSGVGYFEHLGTVNGSTDVAIQFTSGQLNDVLKSLTALDLDAGQIASIGYNSTAPLEQRLGTLLLPLGTNPDTHQFYNALRGARVEVRTGATTVTGRILGVERKPLTRNGTSEQLDVLTVVSTAGAVHTIVLGPEVTVRMTEQNLRDEVTRYLGVMASGRDQDVRRMILSATGDGTRRLLVSYISEVPIWKSTYRLVLGDDTGESDTPLLQGWAIVDNTVGEDWTNVELSLVAGAPQSFVQQISQPYYARRPVVALPQTVLFAPQTHAATLQTGAASPQVQSAPPPPRPAAAAGSVPGGVPGGVAGGVAVGAGGGRGGGAGQGESGAAVDVTSALRGTLGESEVAQARMTSIAAVASAQELGDLFEYRLPQPVTIRTNQSALVPILSAPVTAERVSLWTRGPGSGRPLRAIWLTNATGLTLDGGTFSVIDGGAFAGEGLLDALKPGERRLISYGSDLAVLVDGRQEDSPGRITRVTARNGVFVTIQEDRSRWIYRARNEDASARRVVIEHPLRSGWTIVSDPEPAERTPQAARFVLPVPARGEGSLTISERRSVESRVTIGQVDAGVVAGLAQRGAPSDVLLARLQPLFDARTAVADAERRVNDLTGQVTAIARDQERVRENMKALRGSREERELLQRYTRELSAQEDRLSALQSQLAAASVERAGRQAELAGLIERLSFDIDVD